MTAPKGRQRLSGVHQATAWLLVTPPGDIDLADRELTVELQALSVPVTARSWATVHRHIAEVRAAEDRTVAPVESGAVLVWSWLQLHRPHLPESQLTAQEFASRAVEIEYRRFELGDDDPLLDPPEPGAR